MKISNPYSCDETHIGADYTEDELEFFQAMEQYKRRRRRRYPTYREVLHVVKSLGYVKLPSADPTPDQTA